MKKGFLLSLALLAGTQIVCAQVSNPAVVKVSSAPSGACVGSASGQLVTPAGAIYTCQSGTWMQISGGGGGGTVLSFSSGNLAPLFTTSVATATTTPAQTFTASTAAQNAVLAGSATGGTGAYSFRALVAADIPALAYIPTSSAPVGAIVGTTDTQTLSAKTMAFPTPTNGDVTGTPGFSQTVTSTNSGGTAGIAAGDECQIVHAFVSGSNYSASALCVTTASNTMFFGSGAHAIGSEVWNLLWSTSGALFASAGGISGSNLKSGEISTTSTTTALSVAAQLDTVSLSANLTFTLAAGAAGQSICLQFLEGATGLFTVTPPANVLGFTTVVTTANNRSMQCFIYSTVNTAWTAKSAATQAY